MAAAQFPALPGLAWSVYKEPGFKTRVQKSVDGVEWRAFDQALPIWTFTLTFNFLRDDAVHGELNILRGFFLAQLGAAVPFLYDDPTDDQILGQVIGVGDGVTTQFQLVRTIGALLGSGGYNEPITAPQQVSAIYFNGAQVAPGHTTSLSTGIIAFPSAPAAGTVIAVDFSYFFRVRFADDMADFENFLYRLWQLRQVKLVSVLP